MGEEYKHNDFKSLCAGYVLEVLEDEERKEFELILQEATEEQRKLFEDMKKIRDQLALATEPLVPSPDLEDRIVENIETSKHDRIGNNRKSIPVWVYKAAAAILLIGTLALGYFTADLSQTIKQQEAVITELRNEVERQDELLFVLAAKEVRLVTMRGLEPSPDSYGKVVWDPQNRQAILQLANLPAPPEGKDYQLWLINDGESPVPAGVFNFDQPSDDLFFKVEQLQEVSSPQANSFAVTLEPKGGVLQPTGDMYLLGQRS